MQTENQVCEKSKCAVIELLCHCGAICLEMESARAHPLNSIRLRSHDGPAHRADSTGWVAVDEGEQMAVVPGGSRGRACFPCGIVGCCLVQSNAVRSCAALNTELEHVGSPWKLPLPRRTV